MPKPERNGICKLSPSPHSPTLLSRLPPSVPSPSHSHTSANSDDADDDRRPPSGRTGTTTARRRPFLLLLGLPSWRPLLARGSGHHPAADGRPDRGQEEKVAGLPGQAMVDPEDPGWRRRRHGQSRQSYPSREGCRGGPCGRVEGWVGRPLGTPLPTTTTGAAGSGRDPSSWMGQGGRRPSSSRRGRGWARFCFDRHVGWLARPLRPTPSPSPPPYLLSLSSFVVVVVVPDRPLSSLACTGPPRRAPPQDHEGSR